MIALKSSLSEYTESEFRELIEEICSASGTEEYQDELLEHLIDVTGSADASDWIYYPAEGDDDSVEGVIGKIKAWCVANNMPGFKEG